MPNAKEPREAFRRNVVWDEDTLTGFEGEEQPLGIAGAAAQMEYIELLSMAAVDYVMPFDYQAIKTMSGFVSNDIRMTGSRMDAGARHNAFIHLLRETEFIMNSVIAANEERREREAARHAREEALETEEVGCFFSPKGEGQSLEGSFNIPAGHYRLDPGVFALLARDMGICLPREFNTGVSGIDSDRETGRRTVEPRRGLDFRGQQ